MKASRSRVISSDQMGDQMGHHGQMIIYHKWLSGSPNTRGKSKWTRPTSSLKWRNWSSQFWQAPFRVHTLL